MAGTAVRIGSDHVCELGEGPVYDPMEQRLFWFDINGRQLIERRWSDGRQSIHQLPEMASALALIDERRQLVLTETGLYVREGESGRLERHCAIEDDRPETRSNDARVHPCGAFWVSTMGKNGEPGQGTIYHYFKGRLTPLFPGLSIPNAISFSPRGEVAYFTDSDVGIIYRVACEAASGLPAGEPQPFIDRRGAAGKPDGAVVDGEGAIWNARWGGGALERYSPDGRLLGTIAMPARQVSCPAFVGPQAALMAVTSAHAGLDAMERAADPQAGKLFIFDLDIPGRVEPRVAIA